MLKFSNKWYYKNGVICFDLFLSCDISEIRNMKFADELTRAQEKTETLRHPAG